MVRFGQATRRTTRGRHGHRSEGSFTLAWSLRSPKNGTNPTDSVLQTAALVPRSCRRLVGTTLPVFTTAKVINL